MGELLREPGFRSLEHDLDLESVPLSACFIELMGVVCPISDPETVADLALLLTEGSLVLASVELSYEVLVGVDDCDEVPAKVSEVARLDSDVAGV